MSLHCTLGVDPSESKSKSCLKRVNYWQYGDCCRRGREHTGLSLDIIMPVATWQGQPAAVNLSDGSCTNVAAALRWCNWHCPVWVQYVTD